MTSATDEPDISDKSVGIIGVGTIGSTIIEGLINNGVLEPSQICGSTAHEESATKAQERLGIQVYSTNDKVVERSDTILLAVKPQVMGTVVDEIAPILSDEKLLITVAAAVTTEYIEKKLKGDLPVIRAMPNTPATVNEGVTVLCPGKHATDSDLTLAKKIFQPVGLVEVLREEKLMDAVTGLSGSGPAYGYLIIEALIEAGVKVGLPRDLARTLASQSLLGAAKMVLETGKHPAELKDMVTTPAGVTVDGIMKLEEGGIRVALIKAIVEATDKSGQLNVS